MQDKPMAAWSTKSFLQHVAGKGYLSSVTRDPVLLFAFSLAALSLCAVFKVAMWLLIVLGGFSGICLAVVVVAYFISFKKDPELLRSEHFAIDRLRLEQSLKGDNVVGTFREVNVKKLPIPGVTTEKNNDR